MALLLIVSLVWAFSFGLIKDRLAGLDPAAVAVVRLAFAALVFAPFLRIRRLPGIAALRFALIGVLQFGAMYVFYLRSFLYLQAHEVALFTIFTPVYLALFAAAADRRFRAAHALAALLSVAGAALVVLRATQLQLTLTGLLLVQLSNAAFAVGQVLYRQWRAARRKSPTITSSPCCTRGRS
jgi:drug/metabolite transporter (DMT)-like permease